VLTVSYSFWDGKVHAQTDINVFKGASIRDFLTLALEAMRPVKLVEKLIFVKILISFKNLTELKAAYVDHLVLVKEDVIIPHFYT
jgi:protein FAM50